MTLGSMFDISKGSAFENPGLLGTSPRQVMSLVNNSGAGTQFNDMGLSSGSYFYNPEMLGCLRDWELTEAILDIFESLVSDVLSSSEPIISTGDPVIDADIKKYLDKIGLTQNILDHLKDDLYYGQRSFVVDIEGGGIIPIANERSFYLIEHLGRPYKYQFNGESGNSLIDYNKLCCICFNKRQVAIKRSDNLKLVKNKELNKLIMDLTYYSGQSIVKSSLYLLFIHFLKSLLSTLLTMRNLTRPDLIKANIQPGSNNEQNIVEAINNIEALLNQGDYSFDFRTTNPFAVISTIYNSIANSVKVVPGLANYTEFDMIQQPDISAKIEALNNDINNIKANIISNEGIPDELMGGSSNRWEVMSRSSRLFNKVKGIINDISWTYKTIAKNYVAYKYDKNLVLNQFKFNLDSNNYLYASSLNSKIQLLSDNFDKINNLAKTLLEMKESKLFDQKKSLDYIINALKSTDSTLSGIISTSLTSSDGNEGSDSSSSSSNDGGGGW